MHIQLISIVLDIKSYLISALRVGHLRVIDQRSGAASGRRLIRSPDYRRNELSATPDHLKSSAEYRFDSGATTPDFTRGAAYDHVSAPTDSLGVPGIPGYKSNMSETDSRMFGSMCSGASYTSSFDP